MAANKVIYGTTVLVDLTEDTVTSTHMESGYTAHDASGNKVTGTLQLQKYYTGTTEPTSTTGSNGDLYFLV